MQRFREGHARVTCDRLSKSGMVEAQYSGPMNARAFAALREQALLASTDTTVYVVRLDKALILMGDEAPIDEDSYQSDAPGALVVRHDPVEYARWHLRPNDWHLIWPELIGTPGAPTVPEPEARAA